MEVDDKICADTFGHTLSLADSPVGRRVRKEFSEGSAIGVDPDDDPYDPRKPEYLLPASGEEVTAANELLLKQQIEYLEFALTARQDQMMSSESELSAEEHQRKTDILSHYRKLAVQMRFDAAKIKKQACTEKPRLERPRRVSFFPSDKENEDDANSKGNVFRGRLQRVISTERVAAFRSRTPHNICARQHTAMRFGGTLDCGTIPACGLS